MEVLSLRIMESTSAEEGEKWGVSQFLEKLKASVEVWSQLCYRRVREISFRLRARMQPLSQPVTSRGPNLHICRIISGNSWRSHPVGF